VESCYNLESMRLPMLSTAGFINVISCPGLSLLDVVRIETIDGGLTIDGCQDLPAIIMPTLEIVRGSVAINGVTGMTSCRFDKLAEVAGSFSIAGAHPSAITTLPCSAQSKPWESAAVGTVEYSTGVSIACHDESSVAQISATRSCDDVCGVCVQCETDESAPVVRPGFVQFVGDAATATQESATNVFECKNKLGCHGANSTASAECISKHYEGHFCMSCAPGYRHEATDGADEYECVQCDPTTSGWARAALIVVIIAVCALGVQRWNRGPQQQPKVRIAHSTEALGASIFTETSFDNPVNGGGRLSRDSSDMTLEGVNEGAIAAPSRLSGWLRVLMQAAFQPMRMVVTWVQITAQISGVLQIHYPPMFVSAVDALRFLQDTTKLLFDAECSGMDGFVSQWLVKVVMLPAAAVLCIAGAYGWFRKQTSAAEAMQKARSYSYGAVFLLYPSICNSAFAAFECRELLLGDRSVSILEDDDRLLCTDDVMQLTQFLSKVVIVVVAFGVPVIFCALLLLHAREYQTKSELNVAVALRLASEFEVDHKVADYVLRDVMAMGESFGFLMDAYKFNCYYWEVLDLLRKLLLVGLVLLVDRGSVAQNIVALILSFGFSVLQASTQPYKLQQDNAFRAATEAHVFLVIAAGLALHSDLDNEQIDESWYDWGLFVSFLVLVPGAFCVAVASKVWLVDQSLSEASLKGSFSRLRTGLASITDRDDVRKRVQLIQAALDPDQRKRLGELLHTAVTSSDYQKVTALLEQGADAAYVSNNSINPLHRAARAGDFDIVNALLGSANKTAQIDAHTEFGFTALHLACMHGHADVARILINAGCNIAMVNHRALTAWDLADQRGDGRTGAVFTTVLEEVAAAVSDLTGVMRSHTGDELSTLSTNAQQHPRQLEDLKDEQRRRETRPDVAPARDNLQLKKERFGFWSLGAVHSDWEFIAEGGFGKVYLVPVFPPIQGIAGSQYDQVAIKAAKVGADGELKGETEGLAQLSHEHIVSILGFTYCSPAAGESERWLMILEYCHSDVERLLYGDEPTGVMYAIDKVRSPRGLMLKLALQIAQGLRYIHAADTQHLDLKPENVLLRNTGTDAQPEWQAKIADFGMDAGDLQASTDAEDQLANLHRPGSQNKTWVGTYEYMSPEATGQDAGTFGTAGNAADVYSFGMLMWEMLFGMRVRKGFPGKEMNHVYVAGVQTEDLKTVARWMLNGDRPEISETHPLPLQLLMKACWAGQQEKRIEFQLIVPVLEALCAANDDGVLVDNVPEPNHAPQEQSWDAWLAALGLGDMQDSLGDYLSAGKELLELKQMDDDDLSEDILEDGDLGFDADAKERFRAAVAELKLGADGGDSNGATATAEACGDLVDWIRAEVGSVQKVRAVQAAYDRARTRSDQR
jgi:serine/threonine protein kinase/ankyrin repeat protein